MSSSRSPENFVPKYLRAERMAELRDKHSAINGSELGKSSLPPLLCQTCSTSQYVFESNINGKTIPSPHSLSMFNKKFESKLLDIHFRDDNVTSRMSEQVNQLTLLRRLALLAYKTKTLEPLPSAIARTKKAAKDFFALSYALLNQTHEIFPLADKNKCLGIAVIKDSKRVYIAVSQDVDAKKDIQLRNNLIYFLRRLNMTTDKWRFELVMTPTAMEFILPRTLRMETARPASSDEVNPRMRCVEVQLMVALNKAHRTFKYDPQDVSMLAFSGTLWAHPTEQGGMQYFGNVKRSTKYSEGDALEVELINHTKGYIDVWAPCEEHCAIYLKEMRAIAAADEHFLGPRADEPVDHLSPYVSQDMNIISSRPGNF